MVVVTAEVVLVLVVPRVKIMEERVSNFPVG